MEVKVGIGDYVVVKKIGIISMYGLGFCVGIILYDCLNRVGGLFYVFFFESVCYGGRGNLVKYVDIGLEFLIKDMMKLGVLLRRFEVKFFGGVYMFINVSNENLMVGKKNVEVVKREFKKCGIRLVVEDIGGKGGRIIYLDVSIGKVRMRKVLNGKVIEVVF